MQAAGWAVQGTARAERDRDLDWAAVVWVGALAPAAEVRVVLPEEIVGQPDRVAGCGKAVQLAQGVAEVLAAGGREDLEAQDLEVGLAALQVGTDRVAGVRVLGAREVVALQG